MAKNKKTERQQRQAERGTQQSHDTSMARQAEQRSTQVTPADLAQKGRQKRFGHN
ncbi:hypothetical protein [Streptomyces roseolilacinus]|uniref:Small hydrophilic protein n=1 Tax=Streptomyces roseolilacinus TaxID=66904 RepID=A0A918B446_9ACTN|nr:hypothetical protein [Streptomyces roseolilacinus]GGQ25866.1 hypothetical protein GCM10010249_50970 [Streptomyces roseolilacinus]